MISDVLWGLPGPGRWLDRAAQLTTRERFGKISVPKALVKIAIDGLESLMIEKFGPVRVLSLHELDPPQNSDWLASLGASILSDEVAIGSPRVFAELVGVSGLCMIVDLTESSSAVSKEFIVFCDSIKKAFNGIEKRIALVVVTDDATGELDTPNLFDHVWADVMDTLDVALHLRSAAILGRYATTTVFQEFLASLAEGDLELAELFIEEKWDGDTPCFADVLATRWLRRGVETALCESLSSPELWSLGLLSNPLGGAAALDLPARRDQAQASVWAAQVRVVFPMLERYRTLVVEFAIQLDKRVFLEKVCVSAKVDDQFEAEIVDLWWEREYFPSAKLLLEWMRRVRNDSAHRRPTSWAVLAEGEELLKQLTTAVDAQSRKLPKTS